MAAVLKRRALAEFGSKSEPDDECSVKQLKLGKAHWQSTSGSASAFIALLASCKSSNEALPLLLRVSESGLPDQDAPECVRKLLEHLAVEQESAVRVKVISLLGEIGCMVGVDHTNIIEEIIVWMRKEESHKVIAQGLKTLLVIGNRNASQHFRLVQVAKEFLKDTGHIVKCHCLELIAAMFPVNEPSAEETLNLVGKFAHYEDARVRSSAYLTLVTLSERGAPLSVSFYSQACSSLKDDYETVRLAALQLIAVLAKLYGNQLIRVQDEDLPLGDDAFGKVCLMVTDLSLRVRTLATTVLGSMRNISTKLLQQTLDKKLMSNMRLKLSAHERSKANVTSGEWATGAKWADDAPRQLLDAESVSLVATGSCGALVHSLEDEFLEVRSAGVDAICKLSVENPDFADQSLDFLVDMFNDEIEEVRLRAIESLYQISKHIVLREDQLETILGALKDFSLEVREGLHRVLASCRVSTKDCLQMAIESLLENLKKYPQDRKSTWRCVQAVGARHPELTLPLVPELLAIHPFFDTPEPDVEDPLYITVLILVFNAARNSPTMVALFEKHTVKHYRYLRDTMPNFVPYLKLTKCGRETELSKDDEGSANLFLIGLLHGLSTAPTNRVRLELMAAAQRDLLRISDANPSVGGAPIFLSFFIQCQLLIQQIIVDKFSPYATYEPNTVYRLHQIALQLQYQFINITEVQVAAMLQLKLKALCIRLVKVVKGNSSALSLCQHFMSVTEATHRYMMQHGLPPEPWVRSLFSELLALEDKKPGAVARILFGLMKTMQPSPPPACHEFNIGFCQAVISEPCADADTVLKFTAGLLVSVPFDAEISSLPSTSLLRIKVKYPDQNCVLVLPKKSDLRPLERDNAGSDYRLLTTVLLSHQVWSDPCYVDISLVLDVSGEEGVSHSLKSLVTPDIDPYTIDLCKPVKVYLSPKPVRRGI